LKRQRLETRFSLYIDSTVEDTQALLSYGPTEFNLFNSPPPHVDAVPHSRGLVHVAHVVGDVGVLADALLVRLEVDDVHLVVALQVAFERQTLKPVFHSIGYRLWV
jgi:hypothetical protein